MELAVGGAIIAVVLLALWAASFGNDLGYSATMPQGDKRVLPCVICGQRLGSGDEPSDGVAFTTVDQFPSAVVNPDDTALWINICDKCLVQSAAQGRVNRVEWDVAITGWKPD